jgi:hypothetical protein
MPHHFFQTSVEDSKVDTRLVEHLLLLTDGRPVEPLDLSAPDPLVRENRVCLFDLRDPCFLFRVGWKINLLDLSLSVEARSRDLPALFMA